MLCASGAQSQTANLAISAGDDNRREGCFSDNIASIASAADPPNCARRSAICGATRAVSTQPGQMQLTVTPPVAAVPTAAYSSPATLDNPTSPNFAET